MHSPPVESVLGRFTVVNVELLDSIKRVFSPVNDAPSSLSTPQISSNDGLPSILSVDSALGIIDDFAEILAELRAYVCQTRNRVTLQNTSFGALSLELIQHVIDFTIATPTERTVIIKLSHISHGFRSAVLGMSHLFVNADYRNWSASAIEEWCLRAGSRPLTIASKTFQFEMFHTMLETKNIQMEKASTILLRAVGDGGNRNMGLTSCFSKPLPLLQTLCLDDQRTNMYRHSFQDLFPLYIPTLRSLYLPTSAPSFLGGSFANLNNLGLLVWDTGTLRNFIELISNARSINHLTLYANDSEVIDLEGYTPSSIPVLDFLTSLRLSRYLGSDIDNIHTVVKSFAAPHLGTLELTECGFTIIPEVAIKHVTKLVCSQLYWTTSDDLPDFFRPLYDGSTPSFPKLDTLAVRDEQWRDMGPRIEDNPWWPSLLALIKSREGKLTKLALSFTLPEALQKSLQDYKLEVTADFELDPHGFPMDVL